MKAAGDLGQAMRPMWPRETPHRETRVLILLEIGRLKSFNRPAYAGKIESLQATLDWLAEHGESR